MTKNIKIKHTISYSIYGKVELVKKRFGEDIKYILKADKSVESVRLWTKKIFSEEGTSDFVLPQEIWEWFEEEVLRAYKQADSDLIKRMILLKVIHTREVVRAGFDIAAAEKKYEWNKNMVGMVCLLHDIARFKQSLLGSYSDTKTRFAHAWKGAEMIEKKKFDHLEDLGIDINRVVEAVRHHSAYEYRGGDLYAKLTRDADKLALLRAMPEILKIKIRSFSKEGVSEKVIDAYRRGELIHNADTKTTSNLFVAWLAWEFDMNFEETKRLFVDEGVKKWMFGELKKRGVNL